MFNFIKIHKTRSKLRCGLSNLKVEKYDESLKCLNQALKIMPDCDRAIGFKGLVYEEMGQFNKALDYYDQAIQLNPKRTSAWNSKADLLVKLGKIEEGLHVIDKGLEINKDNIDLLLGKSDIYADSKNYSEVLKIANKILNINENDERGLHLKGFAFQIMGDYDNAFKCYSIFTKLYPKNVNAWYGLAGVYDDIENFEDACFAMKKAIKLDNYNPYYYFIYATYLEKNGDYNSALKMINRALDMDPNATFYYIKGLILENLDRNDEAIKNYEICLNESLDSLKIESNSTNNYIIGISYEKLNQPNKAIEYYKKVLKIDPDCEKAKKRIDKLT